MAENKKQFEIPLYEKPFLSIEEASVYTGIGRDKLYYRKIVLSFYGLAIAE